MEVATRQLENRQAVLTATLEQSWVDPFIRSASRRLASRLDIPGFRKGKAPHGVVERHVGREALVREVIDDLGRAAYDQAAEESGLEPIGLDDLEITEWDPLTLQLTVSLPPVVDLGDYQSIRLEVKEVEVGETDVEEALSDLQQQYAERVPVDRPAQLLDFATMDVEGTIDDRVVLKLEQQEYELSEGGGDPVGDFVDKLVGMSPGEERSFNVTFPDDYEDQELAGNEVSFQVSLHDLQEKLLPAVDDELAKMAGGFETLGELKDNIRQDLYARREAKQQDEMAEELLDAVLEQAEVDCPPFFVSSELEAMIRGLAVELEGQGFTLDGYLRTTGRSMEDLVDEFRPTAEKRVKNSLILTQLVEEEGIEVEDSEIEEDVARMTRAYGQENQALRDALLGNEQIREEVRNRLYGRRIVERLSGMSVVSEAPEAEDGPVEPDGERPSPDPSEAQASADPGSSD